MQSLRKSPSEKNREEGNKIYSTANVEDLDYEERITRLKKALKNYYLAVQEAMTMEELSSAYKNCSIATFDILG
jgi:hypothetical protein